MRRRPAPPRTPHRSRRTASALLAALVLLLAAAPAGAAPLTVSSGLGPQRSAPGGAVVVHDDFEVDGTLAGRGPGAPLGAVWATTGAPAWRAAAGMGGSPGPVGALTAVGTVPGVDVTAVLRAPGDVSGVLSAGAVRYGVAAQAGTGGRVEGGVRCATVLNAGVVVRVDCAVSLWAVVGGAETELCSVIAYPASSQAPPRLRLRTTGASATLSVVGSSSSCTAAVPTALRTQTGVGIAISSDVVLSLLGSNGLVLQMTAVPSGWVP